MRGTPFGPAPIAPTFERSSPSLMASATSKTTHFASRYYVGNQFDFWECPTCCVEPSVKELCR